MMRFLFLSALLLFATVVAFASSRPLQPANRLRTRPSRRSRRRRLNRLPPEAPRKNPRRCGPTTKFQMWAAREAFRSSVTRMPAPILEKQLVEVCASVFRERTKVGNYRSRLRQLHNQLETTEKQISDLRNFNGEGTGTSGGVNMNRGYSRTSVEDQIKILEEKKKQIQAQIGDIEDEARKAESNPATCAKSQLGGVPGRAARRSRRSSHSVTLSYSITAFPLTPHFPIIGRPRPGAAV